MAYKKYYLYKKQASYDQGETWEDTGEYAPSGDPIGTYDTYEECMAQYRTIQSGYTCVGVDKHNQDVYEVSYDGVHWEVVSTSAGTLIEADSPDCGYIPPTPCECSAFTFDTTSHTITDTAQSVTFNYSGCTKPDLSSASTYGWMLIANHEYNAETTVGYITANVSANTSSARTGILYASLSGSTCQNLVISQQAPTPPPIQYRWTQSGTTCIGYDKYQNNIKEQSTDGGVTWTLVTPPEYSASTLIEADSPDCGYIPPTPASPKYVLTLQDSSTASAECDSTSAITSGEVSTQYSRTLASAEIFNCVTEIGYCAFSGCTRLSSVTIPDSVTTIGQEAFGMTNLTSVTIPDSVTNIDNYIFDNCHVLKSAIIGSGITVISNYTFSVCTSLSSVTIPNSVTTIGMWAFNNCSGMTSITIPNSVTSINFASFYKCTSLTSITIKATTPPTLGNMALESTPIANGTGYIYVPSGSVNAYKSASGWSNYSSRIQAIP